MPRLRMLGTLLVVCGLWAATGCSPGNKSNEVQVSGAIAVDGQPIPEGSISFIAVDGAGPTGGGVIQAGRYSANVAPGAKIVVVLGHKVVGQERVFPDRPDSALRDKLEKVTPDAYGQKQLSPLRAKIETSQDDLDFALSSRVPKT